MLEEVIMQGLPPSPPPPSLEDFPSFLADLKEELTVAMLKQRELLTLLTRQSRFTKQQAAMLAGCSVSNVKKAIKLQRLAVHPKGMISRAALIAWLGFDPISDLTDSICSTEQSLRRVTAEIETLLANRQEH